MIHTWRIAFEESRAGLPPDAMIVRAPTAADALTLFGINYGAQADDVATEVSIVEAVDGLGYCPICLRQWAKHGEEPVPRCLFLRGWVLESKLDVIGRKHFGLPAEDAP